MTVALVRELSVIYTIVIKKNSSVINKPILLAVILTSNEMHRKYEELVSGSEILESR